eukprot:gnl/Trimastix_PCT/1998.p1 GENE.gnl/Trimastix_PCT/1998~~gnl/Trimastix_PCT/1998.p1  ORF type:complete len:226 (-),score=9.94 gnl/Trimastix_PCT/1998:534-1211(-)
MNQDHQIPSYPRRPSISSYPPRSSNADLDSKIRILRTEYKKIDGLLKALQAEHHSSLGERDQLQAEIGEMSKSEQTFQFACKRIGDQSVAFRNLISEMENQVRSQKEATRLRAREVSMIPLTTPRAPPIDTEARCSQLRDRHATEVSRLQARIAEQREARIALESQLSVLRNDRQELEQDLATASEVMQQQILTYQQAMDEFNARKRSLVEQLSGPPTRGEWEVV